MRRRRELDLRLGARRELDLRPGANAMTTGDLDLRPCEAATVDD
jgi:hypothetical protein